MTQSGQGEEPSARSPREGIVLPSDGGAPLLPGTTSGEDGRPEHDPYGGRHAAPAHPGDDGHGGYGAPQPGHGSYAHPHQQGRGSYGGPQQPPYGDQQQASYGDQQQPSYGAPQPAPGQTWGQPWGPDQHGQAAQPPAGQHGQHGQSGQGGWPLPADQHQQWGGAQPADSGQWNPAPQQGPGPLPPEGAQPPSYGHGVPGSPLPPTSDEGATQYIPPVPADEGATQYIPPVPGAHGDQQATQYIPPVGARPDEGATQFLPPVGGGALPPETPAEATHYLGTGPHAQRQPGGSDAEATQYIPPVAGQPGQPPYGGDGGDRQPPAEFANLFRGESPAGSTQQMPRFTEPGPGGAAGPAGQGTGRSAPPSFLPPGGRRAVHDDADDHGGRRGSGRTGSRVPLIAAIGVAIVVVGVGAGALMAGGGGGGGGDDQPASASAPVRSGSASTAADPAKEQAVALDKLLADSGSSRASVIGAVADVKACTNLQQAATDLRAAAGQRTDLVTRLDGLTVDELPDHAALTSALTKAWQASAEADNHYAAWADQVAGNKKACRKGQARTTPETQAGNRASGTASAQKTKAAQLWNGIARKYGLTERQPTQL
ncbi:hypothetical protein AB0A66_05810 [Streptomyces longwoodensis]|uniref:hypothetical protein n=1 Tax=Streptomyces longwoodensis TaxID=68231 RepID=UPI0033F09CEE